MAAIADKSTTGPAEPPPQPIAAAALSHAKT
jgi:hypothetical protein